MRIPYDDGSFNRVYAIHTVYFWAHPHQYLREIYRVMKDGARFILGFRSREDPWVMANFPSTIYQFYTGDEVSGFRTDARFTKVQILSQRIGSSVLTFGVAHHRSPS